MFAAFVPTLPLCAGTFRVGPVCKHRVRCVPRVCVRAMKMAATVATEEKMLHAVYRVGNMERTGEFLKALGMSCLRQRDIPEEKYSNAFYGYGTESRGKHFALELTYNYGVDSYKVGNAFAGFRVTLPDLEIVKSRLTQAGFNPMNLDDGPCVCLFMLLVLSILTFVLVSILKEASRLWTLQDMNFKSRKVSDVTLCRG